MLKSVIYTALLLLGVRGVDVQDSQSRMAATDRPAEIEPITAPFQMPQLQKPQFPDKTFIITDYGAIHLKSNANLHFEEEAEVHFNDNPDDYLPVVCTRWAGFEVYNYSPLIYAYQCENITITGSGKLFGHGE
jgi:hypothetical protein